MQHKEDYLLTPKQAAKRLNISKSTLNRWAESGEITFVSLPRGLRRYWQSDVDGLVERNTIRTTKNKKSKPSCRREFLEKKLVAEGLM